MRDNLLIVWRQTKIRPQEYPDTECPYLVKYIWDYFVDLQDERDYGEMGAKPLTSERLDSWSRLNRLRLSAFELKAIKQLDRLFISKQYEKKEEPA